MPKSPWPSPDRIEGEEIAIRGCFTGGDGHAGANKAIAVLQIAAASARAANGSDAILADAELAGLVFGLAVLWHQHKPAHPDGVRGTPAPAHAAALFDQGLQDALALFSRQLTGRRP